MRKRRKMFNRKKTFIREYKNGLFVIIQKCLLGEKILHKPIFGPAGESPVLQLISGVDANYIYDISSDKIDILEVFVPKSANVWIHKWFKYNKKEIIKDWEREDFKKAHREFFV